MKFRQATIEDINYHLKNIYTEMAEEGYALESYELKGAEDGGFPISVQADSP
jgi:hypothetical protein